MSYDNNFTFSSQRIESQDEHQYIPPCQGSSTFYSPSTAREQISKKNTKKQVSKLIYKKHPNVSYQFNSTECVA